MRARLHTAMATLTTDQTKKAVLESHPWMPGRATPSGWLVRSLSTRSQGYKREREREYSSIYPQSRVPPASVSAGCLNELLHAHDELLTMRQQLKAHPAITVTLSQQLMTNDSAGEETPAQGCRITVTSTAAPSLELCHHRTVPSHCHHCTNPVGRGGAEQK